MLSKEIVSLLDSNNVSKNKSLTKQRLEELWKNATREDKTKAVELGDYTDTKAFNNARYQGSISTRMAVALSITFNVNPFYITGESNNKKPLTEAYLNAFLKQNGFEKYCTSNTHEIRKKELLFFAEKVINNVNDKTIERLKIVSDEDLITILKGYLVQSKFDYSSDLINKVDLVKVILVS